MCTPSAPKPAPVVTPPPAAMQAKPLGVDTDDGSISGIASLRAAGSSGLSIRKTAGGNNRAGLSIAGAGNTSGKPRATAPAPAAPSAPSYSYSQPDGGAE